MSEMELATAKKIAAEHECRTYGCTWNAVLADWEPVRFYCSRCGKSVDVATKPLEPPKYREPVALDGHGGSETMYPDAHHATMAGAFVGVLDERGAVFIHTCYANRHAAILLTPEDASLFAAEVARRAALAKEV